MRQPPEPEPSASDEVRAAYLVALGAERAAHGRLAEAEELYHRALDIVGAVPKEER
jgi:hypothetical protein